MLISQIYYKDSAILFKKTLTRNITVYRFRYCTVSLSGLLIYDALSGHILESFSISLRKIYFKSDRQLNEPPDALRRDKPPIDIEDLAKVVETTISITKKKFGYSRYRIKLRLFLNTYILPEIIFDPSLVLSLYIFLLGLLFIDRAFDRVDGEEVLVKKIGSVSDSLRNLVIYYADTRIFLKFYLSRRINKNLPTIIRGLNPEEDIIRATYQISRTINLDRL
ncbi:uncharacterized protein N7477_003987 [Penicillium maclennaniae]|uniref:uncharacterized protein n=1 Tax=Penicillium maclennaniae TaxID=1343394 RepID=UPI00254216C2|nr:uncharacterized protein N7477_003987 [Penicillium maclennaniae]KAJ5678354.1 hypothetical protein N7477_003987 [Penicillium maclennaniae]